MFNCIAMKLSTTLRIYTLLIDSLKYLFCGDTLQRALSVRSYFAKFAIVTVVMILQILILKQLFRQVSHYCHALTRGNSKR